MSKSQIRNIENIFSSNEININLFHQNLANPVDLESERNPEILQLTEGNVFIIRFRKIYNGVKKIVGIRKIAMEKWGRNEEKRQ